MRQVAILCLCLAPFALAQKEKWTAQEQPILDQIRGLRKLSDRERAGVTRDLALRIRALPPGANQVALANNLASLSTEGDFGRDVLQEVAATLAGALRAHPVKGEHGQAAGAYVELAQLVKYEGVQASLDAAPFEQAMSMLEADDAQRRAAGLSLKDLDGKTWDLKDLRGKVVLVNFWATWCPPCRKEIPALDALARRFSGQGLVVLGVSDETDAVVSAYLAANGRVSYPVLLDPGRVTEKRFRIDGIPHSILYDREGKIVAQAIDMRTRQQFLSMLAQAGLE